MNITLNGKKNSTNKKTAFALKNSDEIVILNGYQLENDYPIHENDSICIIKKGTMPNKDELYAMMMARHTPNVHKKISEGKVAIAGLGGLGSHIAISLARIGVGELLLVDYDIVEPSNLNRQNYDITHLGMYKTDALKEQLVKINPFINIKTICEKVTEDNVDIIFADYNIICEAFDNPESKAMLVNSLLINSDKKIVAASGMAGYDSANKIITKRKMKNLYICGDFKSEAKIGIGLMSPRVQVCAGHQSNMVLRLLLNLDKE